MAKSQLAQMYPDKEGEYTDLQVLKSAAGYYIGTLFIHYNDSRSETPGLIEPGSRDSQYFATKEEAEQTLSTMTFQQREHP